MNPDKKIRKMQNLLYTSGVGTLLFSIWSAVKTVLLYIENKSRYSIEVESPELGKLAYTLSGFILILCILLILKIHIHIAKTSMAIGKGEKGNKSYLILSFVIVLINILSYIFLYSDISYADYELMDYVSAIIDFTSTIIYVEVIVFSFMLKKLRG